MKDFDKWNKLKQKIKMFLLKTKSTLSALLFSGSDFSNPRPKPICDLNISNSENKSNRIFEILEKNKMSKDDCIVLGSAILEVKNIRKAGDLDLLVREEIFEDFKKNNVTWEYKLKIKDNGAKREILKGDGLDLKKAFWISNEDYEYITDFDLYKKFIEVENIDGWTFTSLRTLLSAKSQTRREKDLEDCKLIKEYLKNNL
jgi:hypothetical protein